MINTCGIPDLDRTSNAPHFVDVRLPILSHQRNKPCPSIFKGQRRGRGKKLDIITVIGTKFQGMPEFRVGGKQVHQMRTKQTADAPVPTTSSWTFCKPNGMHRFAPALMCDRTDLLPLLLELEKPPQALAVGSLTVTKANNLGPLGLLGPLGNLACNAHI